MKWHDLYLKIQGKKSVTFPLTYSWHVLYNEHKIDKGQGNVCMYVCVCVGGVHVLLISQIALQIYIM